MLKLCIKINNADYYELFIIPENEKARIYDEYDFDTFCKRYRLKPYTKKEIKKIELYIKEDNEQC